MVLRIRCPSSGRRPRRGGRGRPRETVVSRPRGNGAGPVRAAEAGGDIDRGGGQLCFGGRSRFLVRSAVDCSGGCVVGRGNLGRRNAGGFLRIGFGGSRRLAGAGQEQAGLLAHDDVAVNGREAGDEADLVLRTLGRSPGHPNAVRVPDLRPAVLALQLFGGDDVLAIGADVARIAAIFQERIDHQVAFDPDGAVLAGAVEHQPSPEAPRGGPSGGVVDAVRPNGGKARGGHRLLVEQRPAERLRHVQRRAARCQGRKQGQGERERSVRADHGCLP